MAKCNAYPETQAMMAMMETVENCMLKVVERLESES